MPLLSLFLFCNYSNEPTLVDVCSFLRISEHERRLFT